MIKSLLIAHSEQSRAIFFLLYDALVRLVLLLLLKQKDLWKL